MERPHRIVARRHWPFSLQEMQSPCEQGQLWGVFPPGPYVSIVGRRKASSVGLRCAERIACELAEQGVTIVSGGAIGIDAAAHRGALRARGKTLVMAPVWLEHATPGENRPLFDEIVNRDGGYFSLADELAKPFDTNLYFLRNEAMAALCQVLIVGEHGYRSGARNTVKHAEELRRSTFVLPSLYGNSGGLGSNSLLDRGARVLLNVKDVLKILALGATYDNPSWWRRTEPVDYPDDVPRAPTKSKRARSGESAETAEPSAREPSQNLDTGRGRAALRAGSAAGARDPVQFQVLEAILEGKTNVDVICERTQLSASVVQYQLLLLTLAGEVREDERGLLRVVGAARRLAT